MNFIEYRIRKIDAFQQRHKIPSFLYGVIKKYGDDNGGSLSNQLTYSMFTTVFPLLLLLMTILTLVLVNDSSAREAVIKSTFHQFPVVGSQLSDNILALKRDSFLALIIAILALIYGCTNLAGSGIFIMAQVWNIEGSKRPNYINRLVRSIIFLLVLFVGLIITTVLAFFETYGKHNILLALVFQILAIVLSIGLYLATYRALTVKQVATRDLILGSVFAGIIWSILQVFGSYIIGHYLKNDNATYGVFGTVLGLMAWMYLVAEATVYGAEINVVFKLRLWPRSIVQPPLTKADQISIANQATQNQRRPEQKVSTQVKGKPITQDQYLRGNKDNKKVVGTSRTVPKNKK